MNKQKLNDSYDLFNPTQEQKAKMFDKIIKVTYDKKIHRFTKIHYTMATIAAVFVLFLCIHSFNNNVPSTNVDSNQNTGITLILNDPPVTPPSARSMDLAQTNHNDYIYTNDTQSQNSISIIPESINIPDDMVITSESDNVNSTYIGNGARCISITVEPNSETGKKYLEDDNYKKTNINGNNAVVFYDDIYTVYINVENIVYEITAVDITQQELIDILISLT